MKSTITLAIVAVFALSSCQRNHSPNSHFLDGLCLTEGCECEEGYAGDNCDIILVPSAVRITSVILTSLPEFNNGESWDQVGGAPDISIQIKKRHELIYTSKEIKEDADTRHSVAFDELNVELDDVKGEYKIRIMDQDPEHNDFQIVSDVYFNVFTSDGGFPEEIIVHEGETCVKLEVEYIF